MSNGEYDGEMKYDKLKTEENGNGNEVKWFIFYH